MILKQYKGRLLVGVLVLTALVATYQMGDPVQPTASTEGTTTQWEEVVVATGQEQKSQQIDEPDVENEIVPQTTTTQTEPKLTESALPELAEPEEEQSTEIEPVEEERAAESVLTCTLVVSCATVLSHMDELSDHKVTLIPEDGIIFPSTTVSFEAGDSVFDVLLREMKAGGIHMEYENTPIYNSAYIEGIGNLYEFDCGPLSGWIYKVNDWSPNYGTSQYFIENGDKVEILYTCDLGQDVGGTMIEVG